MGEQSSGAEVMARADNDSCIVQLTKRSTDQSQTGLPLTISFAIDLVVLTLSTCAQSLFGRTRGEASRPPPP